MPGCVLPDKLIWQTVFICICIYSALKWQAHDFRAGLLCMVSACFSFSPTCEKYYHYNKFLIPQVSLASLRKSDTNKIPCPVVLFLPSFLCWVWCNLSVCPVHFFCGWILDRCIQCAIMLGWQVRMLLFLPELLFLYFWQGERAWLNHLTTVEDRANLRQ